MNFGACVFICDTAIHPKPASCHWASTSSNLVKAQCHDKSPCETRWWGVQHIRRNVPMGCCPPMSAPWDLSSSDRANVRCFRIFAFSCKDACIQRHPKDSKGRSRPFLALNWSEQASKFPLGLEHIVNMLNYIDLHNIKHFTAFFGKQLPLIASPSSFVPPHMPCLSKQPL